MTVLVSSLIILLHPVQRHASAMTSTVRVDAQWAQAANNIARGWPRRFRDRDGGGTRHVVSDPGRSASTLSFGVTRGVVPSGCRDSAPKHGTRRNQAEQDGNGFPSSFRELFAKTTFRLIFLGSPLPSSILVSSTTDPAKNRAIRPSEAARSHGCSHCLRGGAHRK
jgi:hypothetical protein